MPVSIALHSLREALVEVEPHNLPQIVGELSKHLGWLSLGRNLEMNLRVQVRLDDRRIRSRPCGLSLIGTDAVEVFLWVPRRHDAADVVLVTGRCDDPRVSWQPQQYAYRLPKVDTGLGLRVAQQRLRAACYGL